MVSTAVGAAAAAAGPVVLLIGDLSFLHDLNGLWPRGATASLTWCSSTTTAAASSTSSRRRSWRPTQFEQWFGTPHGLDFRHGVELHGGRYERLEGAHGWATPRSRRPSSEPGVNVLEVRTERVRNVELHREVWARVSEASRLERHARGSGGCTMTRLDIGGLGSTSVAGQRTARRAAAWLHR